MSLNYSTTNNYPESVVGLSWLSKDNLQEDSSVVNNKNFNPDKNTIIFTHGWQNSSIITNSVPNLYSKYTKTYTQNQWIDNGWNVGIFRWVPLSDDDDVLDLNMWSVAPCNTEAKIHVLNGPVGMRYRNKDGKTFSTIKETSPLYNKTVKQIFLEEYMKFFKGPKNPTIEIRMVGHSLGGQLAMVTTDLINSTPNIPHIDRVELLDPYYCAGVRQYYKSDKNISGISSEFSKDAVRQLNPDSANPNVAIVWYQCTSLTNIIGVSDSNDDMKIPIAWQGVKLWYIADVSQAERHCAIIPWYFQTYNYIPLVYLYSGTRWWNAKWSLIKNESAMAGGVSSGYIKKNMGSPIYWIQVNKKYGADNNTINNNDGVNTCLSTDDIFTAEQGEYASSADLLEYF